MCTFYSFSFVIICAALVPLSIFSQTIPGIVNMAGELTDTELAQLGAHFKEMGIKPKVDSQEDVKEWLKGMATSLGDPKPNATPLYIASSFQHFPKITTFCGDEKKNVTYDVWRSEVDCVRREGHTDQAIAQAIRNSLRGEALRIRARLGPDASVDEVLAKMDSVYGVVEQGEMLLAKFYSARQREEEDVVSWSCRLEDLLAHANDKGYVTSSKADELLRTMFWSGLRQSLKEVTGYLYERTTDFDKLRVAIRRCEQDRKLRSQEDKSAKKQVAQAKAAIEVTTSGQSEFKELKGMIQQLATEVKTLKEGQECWGSNQQNFQQTRGRGRGRGFQRKFSSGSDLGTGAGSRSDYQREEDRGFVCWRCGQDGHIAVGCRVRLDHMSHVPLNFTRPTSGDRQ